MMKERGTTMTKLTTEQASFSGNYASNEDILRRLRRIEGQIKGIQRMVEEEKPCRDVLTQVSAVRAATNKVGSAILEKYYRRSMVDIAAGNQPDEAMDELLDTIQKFLGFVE
jgi:DNA-binding FrmR family transcriptional regulator